MQGVIVTCHFHYSFLQHANFTETSYIFLAVYDFEILCFSPRVYLERKQLSSWIKICMCGLLGLYNDHCAFSLCGVFPTH